MEDEIRTAPVVRKRHAHSWRGTGVRDRDGHSIRECVLCFAFEDEDMEVRDD